MTVGGESVQPKPYWRAANVGLALIALTLSIIAIAISGFIMVKAHPPALMADEWNNWSFLVKRGIWDSIYCRHNGHPVFIPNILYRIDAFVFAGNSEVRASITWLGAALSGVGLAALGWRGRCGAGGVDWGWIAMAALVCAMMTCAAMGRGIIWGLTIAYHLPTLGIVIAAFGLGGALRNTGRASVGSIAAIVLGAALATFSFGFGQAVWGALPLVLALASRRFLTPLLVLIAGAIISLLVMKFTPSCAPEAILPPPQAFKAMGFALGVLGAGVASLFSDAPGVTTAVVFGLATITAALWASWVVWNDRGRTPQLSGLLLVIWYALGAALLSGLGRSFFGMEGSLNPRFYVVSFLACAALGMFAYVQLLQGGSRISGLVGSALIACAALVTAQNNVAAVGPSLQRHATQVSALYQLMLTNSASEATALLAPRRGGSVPRRLEAISQVLPYLRERNWDLFRDRLYLRLGTRVADSTIAPERCRGEMRPQRGAMRAQRRQETTRVVGWARYPDGQPANRIVLTRDGVVVGLARSAAHFRDGFSEQRWTSAHGLGELLGARFPDLAITLGFGAEWSGAVQLGANTPLQAYALGADGSLCRLHARS